MNLFSAFKYIQEALAVCVYGDEIYVSEGTYFPDANDLNLDGTNDRIATFNLANGVKLLGGFPSTGDRSQQNPKLNKTIHKKLRHLF